ncbi:MAG: D-alanyl-D-alanine carboxypeptidase family protein [Clostridia bacterium]|nr:D-alanyl-D-alanine carboxypeptidase family protein [Clostridia bacterium]
MTGFSRASLLMALAALGLMLAAGHLTREKAQPVQAAVTLASREGYTLTAGETPPEGEERLFSQEILYQGRLLYVSPTNPLPAGLPAQQARDVRSLVGLYIPAATHVSLSEETIYALCDLAAQNPLVSTWIMAGMRSPGEQAALQKAAFAAYQATLPVAEALRKATQDIPDSGGSEHQLATCFDLRLDGPQDWSGADPMARTADGRWLLTHGWEYGFIRRYPPQKAALTGIANETLHWRFVGRLHARAMHAADWCLEEYLTALHTYGVLRLQTPEGASFWMLCQPLGESVSFSIPQGAEYEVSADNMGWAVCAYRADQSSF